MRAGDFNGIGVVGAGQMGSGIAQVIAAQGFQVVLMDALKDQLCHAKNKIHKSSEKLFKKGTYSEQERKNAVENISYTQELQSLASCDLMIEAICEKESLKKEIFSELDKIASSQAIFASNTSAISIARLAQATSRPERFVGLHFMNPVPLMQLVEVITTIATAEHVKERCTALVKTLKKEYSLSRDFPGFVVNRILMPMINEAFFVLMDHISSAEEIDKAMKLGTNQPMGPLALADFIGLDTCLSIMEVLYEGFKDPKYRPALLLRQYVDLGWLGRKTNRGVFLYQQ